MINKRIDNLQKKIENIAVACGRHSSEINLVGVSKKKPIEMVAEAFDSGLTEIGENYV